MADRAGLTSDDVASASGRIEAAMRQAHPDAPRVLTEAAPR